jgi:protein-L-isoaspartate(D-aspartate) O-methyltransferase
MHASAVERLLPSLLPTPARPSPRVLDIGSGSGYLTHVLAELVGPSGVVVGVEHIKALADLGRGNMAKSKEGREFLSSGRVTFVVGDGRKGWNGQVAGVGVGEEREVGGKEGWDAIHVGASAVKLHEELLEQLAKGGKMFIPVDDEGGTGDQSIWLVEKGDGEDGEVKKKRLFAVRYVPLTDAPRE